MHLKHTWQMSPKESPNSLFFSKCTFPETRVTFPESRVFLKSESMWCMRKGTQRP